MFPSAFSRITTWPATALIVLAVAACDADSPSFGSPFVPEVGEPPVQPPIHSSNVDLLDRLLRDSYSVAGLGRMLRDDVVAEQILAHADRMARALREEDVASFAGSVVELRGMIAEYVDGPFFDRHDLPVVHALHFYVSETEMALRDDEYWRIPANDLGS